jgi:hypothetical protein
MRFLFKVRDVGIRTIAIAQVSVRESHAPCLAAADAATA